MSLRRKTSIAAAAAACSLIASTSSAGIVVVSGFPTASSNSNRIRQQQQQHRHRLYSQHEGPNSGKNNEDGEASHPVSLFEDDTGTDNVKFGDSVPLKGSGSSFGESVPLKRPSPTNNMNNNNKKILVTDPANFLEAATATVDDATTNTPSALAEMKRRNLIVATCSIAFAISSYLWQFSHPITPVQLLADMQTNSAPLTSIGTNGKPTVVDFWAPWCENCKLSAPTLQKLEEEYGSQVNFVMVNGDQAAAWPLIERFGVDAIPHLALINAEGDVETALIGPIPKRILEADLNVLLDNSKSTEKQELPYKMLDVFANQPPESRRVRFNQPATEGESVNTP